MKTQQTIFRQGDVLLTRVMALPKGAKDVTPEDRIVLAYGEVTGHAHAIYPGNGGPVYADDGVTSQAFLDARGKPIKREVKGPMPAKLWDAGAERYLQVLEATALKHEEHAAIPLPPGVYKVTTQREYSPSEIRRVAD